MPYPVASRTAALALALCLLSGAAIGQSAPSAGGAAATAANANLHRATPENAVLVYVDFNTGLDNMLTTIPGPQFRNNVTAFAKLNPVFRMPTAVLGEENDFYGPFFPEIKEHVTHDATRFLRTTMSGYTPEFAAWLAKTGRRTVIIGGISIDNCTLHTALDLLRDGYTVFVVADVSSTNNKLAEDAAMMRLSRAGAVITTWLSISTELMRDWSLPQAKQLQAVVFEHLPASTIGTVNDTTPDGLGMRAPNM